MTIEMDGGPGSVRDSTSSEPARACALVRDYYENFGWRRGRDGLFHDCSLYGDMRAVMLPYRERARRRDGCVFVAGLERFLDTGCGALPAQDYGGRFRVHICIDLTMTGLMECRKQLGKRARYVQGDIARLPFRDGAFDGVYCGQALYVLLREEQLAGVRELLRVLKPGARCVLVYITLGIQRKLLLMAGELLSVVTRLPTRLRQRIRSAIRRKDVGLPAQYAAMRSEVVAPAWFKRVCEELCAEVDVRCHRVMEQPFSSILVPDNRMGAWILALVARLEEVFPRAGIPWSRFITVTLERRREEIR